MKKIKILNNSGISILEVIAAIMIIALGMVGVLSLVIQNVQAQYIDKNVLIASGLAEEGMELVKNIRDLNWLTSGNWKQGIVGTYAIDYRGSSSITAVNSISDAGARLYIDNNGNGFYTDDISAPGNTPTNFYRLITVVDDIDHLDVKCTIRWTQGANNHDYTAETYLYNWEVK
jgi:hypothetical protein